jgi:chromosomal replication initiation ATPase DnaA
MLPEDRIRRDWKENVKAVIAGTDIKIYPQGWALDDTLEPEPMPEKLSTTMRAVMTLVSHISGYSEEELRGSRRRRPMVSYRWMLITLIHRLCPARSMLEIGRFVHRDHTTVIHVLQRFPDLRDRDPDLEADYQACCRHFGIAP